MHMRLNRLFGAVAVLVAALLVASGCSSSGSDAGTASGTSVAGTVTTAAKDNTEEPAKPSKVAKIADFAVGAHSETWVDKTRGTNANGSAPALPTRTFPVLVLYPAEGEGSTATQVDGAKPKGGPWPLIVFSHGVTGKGPLYANSLRVIASAGYVVVAPDYPLSNRDAAGGPVITDVPAQIKDVSFLIDQTLAADKGPGYLHGLVDDDHVGLAGHSLGAITSLGAGYTACCAEPRVDAVAEWAGLFFPIGQKAAVAPVAEHRPLLMIHGDKDGTVPYAVTAGVYDTVGSPKLLVTLPGQGHIPPYVVGEGSAAGKVVVDATVAFFDAELKDDKKGLDRVSKVVADAGPTVATVKEDLG